MIEDCRLSCHLSPTIGNVSLTDHNAAPSGDDDFLDWDDEEYVRLRPAGSRLKRAMIVLGILIVISLVLLFVAKNWVSSQLDPSGEPAEEVEVVVPKDSSVGDIATQLEDAEIIPSAFFFRLYTQWKDESGFQAGEFTFQKNMSANEAIEVLNEGPKEISIITVTIPEGLWISEIIPLLAEELPNVTEDELQEALQSDTKLRYRPEDQESWEGFLFPDTYEFKEDETAVEVIGDLTNRFAQITGELSYGRADRPNALSPYEVIIVASLVEAEAKTDADRPKIARVIYNRLTANTPIGIDATLIYESQKRGVIPTAADLKDEEAPYNSRIRKGLPPTPIAAPGKASLKAALEPEEGDWFWYVLKDEENHLFTEDQKEFDRQKAESRDKGLL